MRQKYRTTCFADPLLDYPVSLEDDPKWRENVVGFRIVHDDVSRVARGGSWYRTAGSALAANRDWSYPGYRSGGIGLRLVADWGE